MPRRRELAGIASGLLGTFISRNNDIGGYWALGKLNQHAQATGATEIRVDLIGASIDPAGPEFSDMVRHFNRRLADQLAARKLRKDWLRAAETRVTFAEANGAETRQSARRE